MKLLRQWMNSPVLIKEFQLRMRNKKTPWVISSYLLIMGGIILSILYLFLASFGNFQTESFMMLFAGLVSVQLLMLAFVVPGITSGLISGERERQTLPILLTTRLSSSEIVISKWVASLSFMFLLVITSFPLYTIVFMYGGISPDHIWKVFIHLIVTMSFVGSLGVFYSSIFKRTGVSTIVTYVTVAVIGIGLIILINIIMLFFTLFNPGSNKIPLIVECIASLHPAISVAYGLFFAEKGHVLGGSLDLKLNIYYVYIITYTILSATLLLLSIYFLSPPRFQVWKWLGRIKKIK